MALAPLDIDQRTEFRSVAQDRDLVVADLDEAAVDGDVLDRPIDEIDPCVALLEGAEETRRDPAWNAISPPPTVRVMTIVASPE